MNAGDDKPLSVLLDLSHDEQGRATHRNSDVATSPSLASSRSLISISSGFHLSGILYANG
jgi:hypothetical protein